MPAETHVERSPIGPDEVLRMIRERLSEILEIDESRITLDAKFTDDLDADSLALIELVEALEEELGERTVGFTFDDEDLADLHTVRDAVDYVVAPARCGCGERRGVRMSPQAARSADPDLDARLQLALGWSFRDHSAARPRAHPPLVLRRTRHRRVERASRVPRRLGARVRRDDVRVRRSTRSSPKASWPSCAPSS